MVFRTFSAPFLNSLQPGATRSAALHACPWLSYCAPLALSCGLVIRWSRRLREDRRIHLSCCNVLAVNLPALRLLFPPPDRETFAVPTSPHSSGLVLPARAFQTLQPKRRTACSGATGQTGRIGQ